MIRNLAGSLQDVGAGDSQASKLSDDLLAFSHRIGLDQYLYDGEATRKAADKDFKGKAKPTRLEAAEAVEAPY